MAMMKYYQLQILLLANDYDVLMTPNGNSIDMTDYLGYSSMDGNRKITFNNTATSTYSIKHADRLLNVPIEFANENVNVTFLIQVYIIMVEPRLKNLFLAREIMY